MANEWETAELGEVATVRSGYAFSSTDWTDSGVPVVKIANVKGGRLDMAGCSFVLPAVAAQAGEFNLQDRDIVIAMTGYIGQVSRVRFADLPCVLNQRVGRFSVRDRKRLRDDYLYCFLSWAETRKAIESLGYGSAQPNVSPGLMHKIEIPLPPPREQAAIAAILGALDDKIELNRRMNETLEAMARALFKSWFVDFDPVRAKAEGGQPWGMDAETAALFPSEFEGSELGEIPKGWRVATVGQIACASRDSTDPSNLPPNTPYIGLEHMPRSSIALAEWETAEKVTSGKLVFHKGDVLFGKLRPYFKKVGVAPLNGVCSSDILVIEPKKHRFGQVLLQLADQEFIDYTEAVSGGTRMPRVSWADVARYPVALPPETVGAAFDLSVERLTERIRVGIFESRTLAELRDTLLPKLLSGEVRVRDAESAVGAGS